MKNFALTAMILAAMMAFSACTLGFSGPDSGDDGDNQGPDSGDEIDLSQEPKSPDSGDDGDNQGPDSGEDGDNQGPDSGDEIDLSQEPKSPDSGEDADNQGPDSGEDGDNQGPDSGDEIDLPQEPTSPDSGDEIDSNEPTSPDSGDEITLDEDLKNRAKGSCNKIAEGSTCVEYIGSYWGQGENAKLNCSEAFARSACPRPALGGCRIGSETPNEIVTWHYSYGGDPYTEALPYAAQACRNLPGTQWVQ